MAWFDDFDGAPDAAPEHRLIGQGIDQLDAVEDLREEALNARAIDYAMEAGEMLEIMQAPITNLQIL